MFSTFDISASALRAQRVRMNVIANNVANSHTTRNADGESIPFRRRMAIFMQGVPEKGSKRDGVSVLDIMEDPSDFRLEYNPDHPDAIKTGPEAGYLRMPNMHPIVEMVDFMEATRAYEANVSIIEQTKTIGNAALQILS